MKLRPLVLTVVILAVLSAAAYFLQRPGPPPATDPRVGQPLLDRATIAKAQQFRVSDQGKTVTLARQPDASWRVVSYYDFPADFDKLSRFVTDLTDAKPQRLVTTRPERLARLGFKDSKVELLAADGQPLWSLTLGKYAETGGGRFIRFGDEQKAYVANLSLWLDTEAKNWADSQLLHLKADEVAKLEIPFADGSPVVFSRVNKSAPWTADKNPAHEIVHTDKISSTLSSLDGLRFTDTTGLNDPQIAAAQPHTRTFQLTTFDGTTYTVAFARQPEQKKLKPAAPAAKEPAKKGAKPAESKPAKPEYETIPAGPVFVTVASSDASAPVNALMKKRAFEVSDYVFTGLPQKPSDLFTAAPPPPAKPAPKPSAPEPAKP